MKTHLSIFLLVLSLNTACAASPTEQEKVTAEPLQETSQNQDIGPQSETVPDDEPISLETSSTSEAITDKATEEILPPEPEELITTGTVTQSGNSNISTEAMPYTSTQNPDGTLIVEWTKTLARGQGNLIKKLTFAPNESFAASLEIEYSEFSQMNETLEGNHFEMVNVNTVVDHTNVVTYNFSSPLHE